MPALLTNSFLWGIMLPLGLRVSTSNTVAEHRNWGEIPRRTRRRDGGAFSQAIADQERQPCQPLAFAISWEGEKMR